MIITIHGPPRPGQSSAARAPGPPPGSRVLVPAPVERARRRQREMARRGEMVDLEEVLRAQEVRDRRDAARDLAPMVPAADAVKVDSTHLTVEQLVDHMEQIVRRCKSGSPGS